MGRFNFLKITNLPLILLIISIIHSPSRAQDEVVAGSLSIGNGLKAGLNSSTSNFEFRENGILISKGTNNDSINWLESGDQGDGTRFLWYPGKAALRVGYTWGDRWNDANIGNASVALGWGSKASGWGAIAIGQECISSGADSVALGGGNKATGDYSFAGGINTEAYGSQSMTFGGGTRAHGWTSSAFGFYTVANGRISAVFGEGTESAASHSFAIGRFNVRGGDWNSWVASDPLFEIGNGTDGDNRSNAFTVYKNGNAALQGVLTVAPGGDLSMGEFTTSPQ